MTIAVPAFISAGIDVSASMLDSHLYPLNKSSRFANDETGITGLCRHLKDHNVSACVFEVTGHYSRALHKGLHEAGLPAIPVNPRQASFFIKSHSPSHKTDKSDAAALAAMAMALPLRVTPPRSDQEQELYELVIARPGGGRGQGRTSSHNAQPRHCARTAPCRTCCWP